MRLTPPTLAAIQIFEKGSFKFKISDASATELAAPVHNRVWRTLQVSANKIVRSQSRRPAESIACGMSCGAKKFLKLALYFRRESRLSTMRKMLCGNMLGRFTFLTVKVYHTPTALLAQ
jgi:hypothetical protein